MSDLEDLRDLESVSSEAYTINSLASSETDNHRVVHNQSRTSEISRIISGIKDDFTQEPYYVSTYDANNDVISQLAGRETTRGSRDAHNHRGLTSEKYPLGVDDLTTDSSLDPCDTDATIIEENSLDQGPPLDEGYAWVVAVSGCILVFTTWGANAGYGVFLAFYLDHDTFHGASQYDFAIIGGMVILIAQSLAPVCVVLYKILGPYTIFYLGVILQCCGFLLASFATKLWQLYLTQGLLIGISFLFVYIPATLVLPTWFDKRRAFAFGILSSGTGLGGIFFSLTINKLIEVTGNQRWPLRMCCFVNLLLGLVACSLMRPRNFKQPPYSKTLERNYIVSNIKSTFSLQPFKQQKGLIIMTFWYGIIILGYTLVLYLMSAMAISVGLSPSQGTVITAVLNAAQTVGRPGCGLIADKVGRFNFTAICCIILAVLIFGFLMNISTYPAFLACSVLMGLFVGIGSLMCQPLVRDILGETGPLAPAWSGVNIFSAPLPFVSEVIALAMKNPNASRPFKNTQIFAGFIYIASCLLLLPVKESVVRQILQERLARAQEGVKATTKGGYLKNDDDRDKEDRDMLEQRVERYTILLRPTLWAYIIRCVYPIRV